MWLVFRYLEGDRLYTISHKEFDHAPMVGDCLTCIQFGAMRDIIKNPEPESAWDEVNPDDNERFYSMNFRVKARQWDKDILFIALELGEPIVEIEY